MPHKSRIKPKSTRYRIMQVLSITAVLTALFTPFLMDLAYEFGRETVQDDIIRVIHKQDNVKLDRIIITTRNGRGNEYSVVFPAENWEG